MNPFIESLGFEDFMPLAGDMSPRRYYRGFKGGRSSVIMLYPEASAESRQELRSFVRIGRWLRAQGLKAPEVLTVDEDLCCAQIEDLGAVSFGQALRAGKASPEELYGLACDVLRHLRESLSPPDLDDYYKSAVHYKRRQLVEYYLPAALGAPYSEAQMETYLAAWEAVESRLTPLPQIFLHMDFHLENLMFLPAETGLKRCGLIDFQEACRGPAPYDLVNLLQDARIDVPEDLRKAMMARACEGMSAAESENFRGWARVLAAQFHCRVLGLFIMQAVENGRDEYLIHLPRLQNYIAHALQEPLLEPLKRWTDQEKLDFGAVNDFNGDAIRKKFNQFVIPNAELSCDARRAKHEGGGIS